MVLYKFCIIVIIISMDGRCSVAGKPKDTGQNLLTTHLSFGTHTSGYVLSNGLLKASAHGNQAICYPPTANKNNKKLMKEKNN